MPRKGAVPKRVSLPDFKYNDTVVAKLVNKLTEDGKKSKAEGVLYKALDLAGERLKLDPLKAFRKAIDNVKPVVETKSRRVGGATYQVPVEVRSDRQMSLALRWLVSYSRQRGEKGMVEKLAGEIVDACNGKGGAVKKREDVHKMAEANKAFAHYRW